MRAAPISGRFNTKSPRERQAQGDASDKCIACIEEHARSCGKKWEAFRRRFRISARERPPLAA
jgi:hypothetical protein